MVRPNKMAVSIDSPRKRGAVGYTLIELVLVVTLIVIVLAIAMPRLLPVFAFSQLEGSARHIANYGRSAIAYSAFKQEPITFRFDFATGEYACLRWVEKDDGLFADKDAGIPDTQVVEANAANALNLVNQQGGSPQERAQQALEFEYQMDLAFRRSLEARARNVPQEGLLADVNPMEEFNFSLDENEEEQREEVTASTLTRTALPEGVSVESIRVGSEEYTKGVVDIEITPVGLSDAVTFIVKSTDDDYFTVEWDPITGGAHLTRGKGGIE